MATSAFNSSSNPSRNAQALGDLFRKPARERRPFEVSLRWHREGTWIRKDEIYT